MIYSYEAKNETGRTVTGSIEAASEQAAVTQIRTMGYFLMRLAPQNGAAAGNGATDSGDTFALRSAPASGNWLAVHLIYPIWSGVSVRDLAIFYRQFATLIDAGVPIYQSLTTLTAQTASPTLRRCTQTIGEAVRQGGNLSTAMGEYPWIFRDFHRAMIVAGEASGRLDLMFRRLADALEQEYALRNNVKRELTYPFLVILAAFLLPPLFYLFVGNVRGYIFAALVPLLEFFAAIFGVYLLTRLGSQFKTAYDAVTSWLPAVGGAVRMVTMARFCRALASLYSSGIVIPRAIRYAAAACGNAFLGNKMLRAVPLIESGQDFTGALASTNAFPPLVVSMMGTGEQTGSLDQTMDKVAEYYEGEAVLRLHQLSVTLGVIVLIIVAIRVAIIVINFYTGYFSGLLNETG